MDERVYYIWFQLVFGFGSRRAELFDRYFESPKAIWEQVQSGGQAADMLLDGERKASGPALEQAANILRRSLAKGCGVATPADGDYPELLRHVFSKPMVLYFKGDLSCLDGCAIGMVGTRTHTEYGEKAAEHLAGGLARGGAVVVSGLAKGIDTVCHRAALAAGGKTVGILGCGLDIDYPSGSSSLKREMANNGAVVSEFPFGTQPLPRHFPIRNRIISGMSRGVVVVEADVQSGSMITAHHAMEQGRDVFAVPGGIFSGHSGGCHQLIKDGAKMVDCAGDILEEYGCEARPIFQQPHKEAGHGTTIIREPQPAQQELLSPAPLPQEVSDGGKEVYGVLRRLGQSSVEGLAAESGFEIAKLHIALTELELYGVVHSLPGRMYACGGGR